jgi:DNA-binding transcriptional MerR regulator
MTTLEAGPDRLLKIGELARRSGLPISTVRHYIQAGLLGLPRKTARNMAYYDASALSKIELIRRLKDELFLPLRLIKTLLETYDDLDVEDYQRILEVRNRLGDRYGELLPAIARVPSAVIEQLELSGEEIAALEGAGVVAPRAGEGGKSYDEVDYRILQALSAVRAAGFGPDLATIEDLQVYVAAARDLARLEARLFARRIGSDRGAEQIVALIKEGIPVVNEVIAALHQKFLLDALRLLEQSHGRAGAMGVSRGMGSPDEGSSFEGKPGMGRAKGKGRPS